MRYEFLNEGHIADVLAIEKAGGYEVASALGRPNYVLGAFVDNRLVAYCTCEESEVVPNGLVLADLYVLPEWRSQGIASGLISFVQKRGFSIGLSPETTALKEFYRKFGFKNSHIEGWMYWLPKK